MQGTLRNALLGVVLVSILSGCYHWQTEVTKQASFDHNCPVENVRILGDNGDNIARAVRLDVCGNRRMYRDIGGDQIYLWQDMTETTSGGSSAMR